MNITVKLLFTGMGTVFFVLILVVVLGNLLIRFSNYMSSSPPQTQSEELSGSNGDVNPKTWAAIVAATEIVTEGKGKVVTVERIKYV